jgi:hypothetical protein
VPSSLLCDAMPGKKRFPVRLPEELLERLAQIAQEEERSVNNLIAYIVRRWLEEREKRGQGAE